MDLGGREFGRWGDLGGEWEMGWGIRERTGAVAGPLFLYRLICTGWCGGELADAGLTRCVDAFGRCSWRGLDGEGAALRPNPCHVGSFEGLGECGEESSTWY